MYEYRAKNMKVISKKTPFTCPILEVEERKVIINDGSKQTHWIVKRQPCISVIALTNDKKIILAQEKRGKNNQIFTELISGKINSYTPSIKEAKAQALKELLEEAGYAAKKTELIDTYEVASNWLERKYYRFAAWNLEYQGPKRDINEEESINIILVSPNKAKQMVKQNEISWENEGEVILKAISFFRKKNML